MKSTLSLLNTMSSTYWSSEEDKTLIDFVRKHEAIYNIKHKQHRNTELKQKWWQEIGIILNKTDFDCLKRWNYIRDYYVRRKAKLGSSGETARKRADLLSFLDNYPSCQKGSFTNVAEENSGDIIMELSRDMPTPENVTIIMESNENSEDTEFKQEIQDNSDIEISNNVQSDKKRKHESYGEERIKLLKQIIDNQNSCQKELDENDLFFASMAKIVKKLPRYEQAQLRMQIGSLVGNAELRQCSNNRDND